MTTSAFRLLLTTLALGAAIAGCKPMGASSSMRDKITKDADPAFLKKVKNDPFPSAGQAAKSTETADSGRTSVSVNTTKPDPTKLGTPNANAMNAIIARNSASTANAGRSTTRPNGALNAVPLNASQPGSTKPGAAATAGDTDDETLPDAVVSDTDAPAATTATRTMLPLRRSPSAPIRRN